jgi:hypothetical protein
MIFVRFDYCGFNPLRRSCSLMHKPSLEWPNARLGDVIPTFVASNLLARVDLRSGASDDDEIATVIRQLISARLRPHVFATHSIPAGPKAIWLQSTRADFSASRECASPHRRAAVSPGSM